MKLKFLTAFTCFTAAVLTFSPPVRADEKEADDKEPAEEAPGGRPSPEELEKQLKEQAEQEKEQVGKMMKVFSVLEGSWTGKENLRYEEDVLPAKTWKDEWEGKYTFGGRYFEMHGQTSGEMASSYKWICTWDANEQRYRAWYFGDSAQNEYSGKLSQDGTFVIWEIKSPNGSTSRFTMKADGNRVKCHGTDTLADGSLFSTQTSEYTRKRVEL
jgi:hypothetical protein